jgi:hypothetical protein
VVEIQFIFKGLDLSSNEWWWFAANGNGETAPGVPERRNDTPEVAEWAGEYF